jgi:hypothetical protein
MRQPTLTSRLGRLVYFLGSKILSAGLIKWLYSRCLAIIPMFPFGRFPNQTQLEAKQSEASASLSDLTGVPEHFSVLY